METQLNEMACRKETMQPAADGPTSTSDDGVTQQMNSATAELEKIKVFKFAMGGCGRGGGGELGGFRPRMEAVLVMSDFRQVVQNSAVAWISGAEAVALWFDNQRQVVGSEPASFSCDSSLSCPSLCSPSPSLSAEVNNCRKSLSSMTS